MGRGGSEASKKLRFDRVVSSSLALVLSVGLASCRAERGAGGLTLERALAADWSALEVRIVTTLPEDREGGSAVVFLHGYGGGGDEYAALANDLFGGEGRVFLPTAVLPHVSGGGAVWWEFLDEDWPKPYSDDPASNHWPASAQLPPAREAIVDLIAEIRGRYRPETFVIGGYSQGAMLALDVAVAVEPPVDRVVLISGYVLLDSVPNIERERRSHPRVLVAHGRGDTVVAFERAERMKGLLERSGFPVAFAPHHGGHGLDAAATRSVRDFLLP